ncbi:FUSC family protein [Nonomuraea basaltis]|uniref:FUSC family protein n=1 Tax=Nonomuraea basaltis TaxID=2495887 RepID=UPI00110C464E|nr:FUSC family protein [Nonomuraea basaltis]TMR92621.1 FUSC family protein [Nonomuraea basaltis]
MAIELRRMAIAGLGLGGPVAWGVVSGRPEFGMLAALGALAVSGISMTGGTRARLTRGACTMAAITVAGFAGTALAGRGWITALAVVLVAAVAAIPAGMSRPMAEHAIRFITVLVITIGLSAGADPVGVALLYAAGAVWGLLLALLLTRKEPGTSPPALRWREALRRWRGALRRWHYPARLTCCLAAAGAIGLLWPQPTSSWISLTVVIVVRPRLDDALRRPFERAAGTGAGVLVGSAVLLWAPPSWLFVLLVGMLGALRPLLKDRHDTLYATVMTPLVLLLMDGGQGVSAATIGYRLADTAIGCALALGLGYLPWIRRHQDRSARAALD